MKKKQITIYLLLCLMVYGFSAYGQWTQEKGKGYYKVGVWWLEADQHYTKIGKIDPNATRGLLINSFFGRYGIRDDISLIVYIPHTRVYQNKQVFSSGRESINGEAFSGLGDINLGFEYQWLKKNGWAISSSLTLGLPTGNNRGGSDGSFQTGDGEFNQILRFHIGNSYQIGKRNFYIKGSFGINQRSKGFSDELRATVETGTKILAKKVLVLGRINIIESFQNGTLDATNSNGSIFANNMEVINLGGELIYNFYKGCSISLSSAYPIRGQLIFRAPVFTSGISLQL